jgi:hypothetical protein
MSKVQTLLPFLFFLPSRLSLALAREARAAAAKNQTVPWLDPFSRPFSLCRRLTCFLRCGESPKTPLCLRVQPNFHVAVAKKTESNKCACVFCPICLYAYIPLCIYDYMPICVEAYMALWLYANSRINLYARMPICLYANMGITSCQWHLDIEQTVGFQRICVYEA